MNVQQNINQMLSLAGLLYTQSSLGEQRKQTQAKLSDIKLEEKTKLARLKGVGEGIEDTESYAYQEAVAEVKAKSAEERFAATGKGFKEWIAKHKEAKKLSSLAEKEERAEQNRLAADAAEQERINQTNSTIEMIRRAGSWYTGGERLDNDE